jgi:hypothetical protein
MPVSEFGEIGRLVKYYSESNEVIIWAVTEFKDGVCKTSSGFIRAKPAEYFAPTAHERSLSPCTRRAYDYVKRTYPNAKCSGVH